MPNKVSYILEFVGIDIALVKLKEIDRILERITRHRSSVFLGGTDGTGGNQHGGGNYIVPPVSGGTGGVGKSAALGTLAGDVLGGAIMGKTASREIKSSFADLFSKMDPEKWPNRPDHLPPLPTTPTSGGPPPGSAAEMMQAAARLKKQKDAFIEEFKKKLMGEMTQIADILKEDEEKPENQKTATYKKFIEQQKKLFEQKLQELSADRFAVLAEEAFKQSKQTGPIKYPHAASDAIPPHLSGTSNQEKALQLFNKLPGSETINNNIKKFGDALKNSGLSKEIYSFGGFIGKFNRFGGILVAITAAAGGLYLAFKLLIRGFKEGSDAYQKGAASGVGILKSNQLENALAAMGITEKPTFQMFGAGNKPEDIIGAARSSGFGSAQQLMNMSEDFKRSMADAASSAKQMEISGKANQMISQEWLAIGREFKALLAQISASIQPLLHAIFQQIINTLKLFNSLVELINRIKSLIPGGGQIIGGGIASGKPGEARWPGGGGGNITAWEKIGFVMARGGATQDIKTTAINTTKLVDIETNIQEILKGILKSGALIPGTQFLP